MAVPKKPATSFADNILLLMKMTNVFFDLHSVTCMQVLNKVASSSPGRSGGRIFFSRVNFLCSSSFGVRSTPVLQQWHVKDPGYSAKSAGGRLHLHTQTPLTKWKLELADCAVRHSVETYKGKRAQTQLVRKHSATVVSARWAIVDWSWPKKMEAVCASWSPLLKKRRKKKKEKKKKRKKAQAGNESSNLPQKSSQTSKKPSPPPPLCRWIFSVWTILTEIGHSGSCDRKRGWVVHWPLRRVTTSKARLSFP